MNKLLRSLLAVGVVGLGTPSLASAQPAPPPNEDERWIDPPETAPPAKRVEPAKPAEPPNGAPVVVHTEGGVIIHAPSVTVIEGDPADAPQPPPIKPVPPPAPAPPPAAPAFKLDSLRLAPPPPLESLDAVHPSRGHFVMRGGGSMATMSIFGDAGNYMGGGHFGLGADTKWVSVMPEFTLMYGKTSAGLSTALFTFAVDIEFPIGPVRLGFGPTFGGMSIGRVTNSGSIDMFYIGLEGVASVDMIKADGFTMALVAKPSVAEASSFFGGSSGGIYGATFNLDFRGRFARSRPRTK